MERKEIRREKIQNLISVTALRKGLGLSKWDARGEDFVFIGYDIESKAYRLWRRGTSN